MTPTRTLEVQCTHAEFLSRLPHACGLRPYEIVDGRIVAHRADGREVHITVHDEPIRRLGSLALPMESVRFDFPDQGESEAEEFMASWRAHTMRTGGG